MQIFQEDCQIFGTISNLTHHSKKTLYNAYHKVG